MSSRQGGQAQDDEDDYFLPADDQRVFGAGIRRKRVPFVRSSDLNTTTTQSSKPSGPSIADSYLSIVLKKDNLANKPSSSSSSSSSSSPNTLTAEPNPSTQLSHSTPTTPSTTSPAPPPNQSTSTCEICNLPLSENQHPTEDSNTTVDKPHEASLAHQVCLTHSHPPSHLDRTHIGLRYLSTYGWDPDSRLGLGAAGREGIREPLKGRVKDDKAGLGAGLDADGDPIKAPPAPPPKKVQKLNAKQVRQNQLEERKRAEKLRNAFFMSDDVLRYLGEE